MKHRSATHAFMVSLIFLATASLPAEAGGELDRPRKSYLAAARLFEERRFGEALVTAQRAIEERRNLSARVLAAVDAVRVTPEAGKSGDAAAVLIKALGEKDVTERDEAIFEEASQGSPVALARLYAKREISPPLARFIEAFLVIAAFRPEVANAGSLVGLAEAARILGEYPEAELLLGKIYRAEGELRLAELQFMRARDMTASLAIPDERFAILSELASIWRDQRRWREYEECLLSIEISAAIWQARQDALRAAMERSLLQEGFDRFMFLYRLPLGASASASLDLGEYYLERGRSSPAYTRLAMAANSLVSHLVENMARDDIDYVYTDLKDFLDRVARSSPLRGYAEDAGLYKALVLLGEAIWFQGQGRDKAQYLWRAVARRPEAGGWGGRATRNLASPPQPLVIAP